MEQGLTDFGAAAKGSVSFRSVPKLSVSFRSFPRLGGGGTVCSQTVLLDTRTEHSLTSKLWHPPDSRKRFSDEQSQFAGRENRGKRSCRRDIPTGGRTTAPQNKPISWKTGGPSAECGVRRVQLGTHFPSLFALFAAKNKEGIDTHGLTDFGAAAKGSVSFRSFPRLGGGGTVCSQTVLLDTRTEHSLTSKLWHPQVQA
ncbi:unnamed protein product [marine sediment metagenome]|uniref:Uncharacterized protein n=1 Tax=marine sediment metagenome TaxID=412755 RepID=X1GT21_9ZZZZ